MLYTTVIRIWVYILIELIVLHMQMSTKSCVVHLYNSVGYDHYIMNCNSLLQTNKNIEAQICHGSVNYNDIRSNIVDDKISV